MELTKKETLAFLVSGEIDREQFVPNGVFEFTHVGGRNDIAIIKRDALFGFRYCSAGNRVCSLELVWRAKDGIGHKYVAWSSLTELFVEEVCASEIRKCVEFPDENLIDVAVRYKEGNEIKKNSAKGLFIAD